MLDSSTLCALICVSMIGMLALVTLLPLMAATVKVILWAAEQVAYFVEEHDANKLDRYVFGSDVRLSVKIMNIRKSL